MLRVTFLLLLLGLAACPATPSTLDEDETTGDDDDDATPAPVALDALTAQIGEAVCEAVLGCCSMEDQGAWFAPVTNILELVGFESEVPPATALEAATCPALVEELLETGPFRDWLDLAANGAVGYSETEAGACLERLRGARCGAETGRSYLWGWLGRNIDLTSDRGCGDIGRLLLLITSDGRGRVRFLCRGFLSGP